MYRLMVSTIGFFLAVGSLYSWTGPVHRGITRAVAELVPFPADSFPYIEILSNGSVAPDKRGKGFIPPSCHGLNPAPQGRERQGGALYAYTSILNSLHRSCDRTTYWFNVGRCLHLIQDLSQPFHTGSGNNERLFHSLYEKEVERYFPELLAKAMNACSMEEYSSASLWWKPGSFFSTGDNSIHRLPVKIARKGRADYDRLHELCRESLWGVELENLTERAFENALNGSAVLLVYAVENEPFSHEKKSLNEQHVLSETHEILLVNWCFFLWVHLFVYCRSRRRK